MPKLRYASFASERIHAQVKRSTKRFDQLADDLLSLCCALLRIHGIRVLSLRYRRHEERRDGQSQSCCSKLHPHSTEPPFTFRISPVMKLARSDARNRIGPAISSAVAARPSGITLAAIFCPALLFNTGFDMSVATHPGATLFTRIP